MNINNSQLINGIKYVVETQQRLKDIILESNKSIQREVINQHLQTNNLIQNGLQSVENNLNNNTNLLSNQMRNFQSNS